MPGPWDKYKTAAPVAAAPGAGPWTKYAKPAPEPTPAADMPAMPSIVDVAMRSNPLTTGLAAGLDALHVDKNKLVTQGGSGLADGLLGSLKFMANAGTYGGFDMVARSVPALDIFGHAQNALDSVLAPKPTDLVGNIERGVGTGIGGALVPEAAAAKGALTLADFLKSLAPAASGGAAQGIAQQVAPDNPTAQLIAAIFGGMAPTAVKASATRLMDGSSGFETAAGEAVPQKLVKALERDQIAPENAGTAVADISPAATVADLGDNTQKLAAAIATQPGEAGAKVTNAMKQRSKDSMTRVPAAVNDALGPATPPSAVAADIKTNMGEVGPKYDQVLANAGRVHLASLAQNLDAQIATLKGPALAAAKAVREMLNVNGANASDLGDKLETSAKGLFEIRHGVDDLFAENMAPKAKRVLTQAREQIDAMLEAAAPGIKELDAQYHELGRQGRALEAGSSVLDTGKNAVWPQDNATAVAEGVQPAGNLVGPSAAAFRLSQGARAEIERIVGTKTNDRVALANLVQGESDWNPQKLAQLFGQDKADKIMQVVQSERRLAETENLAVNGSKTAAVSAAQKDLSVSPVTPSGVRGRSMVDAAFELADAVTRHALSKGREKEAGAIADAILSKGDWTKVDRPFLTPQQQAALIAAASSGAAGATR